MEVKRTRSLGFTEQTDLVLVHIFSRLPAKSLMRFKCVSKRWKYIITHDKCLIKLHEAHRAKEVTCFLVCPTWSRFVHETPACAFPGRVEIKSIMFSPDDLKFDGDEWGSPSYLDGTDVTLFRSHSNVILNAGYNVLPPVNGLVCFVNRDEPDSFLIYNPSTGEKTPWIRTSTSELFVSDFGQQQVAASPESFRLKCMYMFGFGYDPVTRKHKVLYIYVIFVFKRGRRLGFESFNIFDRCKVMCGVYTVGENKWRILNNHQVPLRISLIKKYAYINGCLCWIRYRLHPKKSEVIVFDVGREIFKIIPIPDLIRGLYASCNTGKLVDELVEVDGNLTLLIEEKDDELNLWKYIDNNDNAGGKLIKETIRMPCRWAELLNLDFKAIAGTKLAVVKFIKFRQFKQHECLLYYNREQKKYYRNRHESQFHTYAAGARYQITPFVETLLPIQATVDGEEIN